MPAGPETLGQVGEPGAIGGAFIGLVVREAALFRFAGEHLEHDAPLPKIVSGDWPAGRTPGFGRGWATDQRRECP